MVQMQRNTDRMRRKPPARAISGYRYLATDELPSSGGESEGEKMKNNAYNISYWYTKDVHFF